MADDTSERPFQAVEHITPRQSISAGRDTLRGSPGSTTDFDSPARQVEKTIDESTTAKGADDSSDEKANLQKLDSKVQVAKQDKNPGGDPFGHMSPEEAAILRRQVETPDVKVGVKALYRYATTVDLILLFVAAFCSIVSGVILPLMTIVFGSLQGTFAGFFNGTVSQASFNGEMVHLVLYFVYLGIGMFVTVYLSTVIFIYTGEHVTGKVRERYLESCLKQNIVSSGYNKSSPSPPSPSFPRLERPTNSIEF